MYRWIHAATQKLNSSARYDYSNIIGIGRVDSRARRYLDTLPDWIEDNMIKFTIDNVRSTSYTLVVEPLESDPDPRPLIFRASKISELRNKVAKYEKTYIAEDRYTDTGYRAMI